MSELEINVAEVTITDAEGETLELRALLRRPGNFGAPNEPRAQQGCMTACPECGARLRQRTWVDDGTSDDGTARKVEMGTVDGGTRMVDPFAFVELYRCGALHAYGVRDEGRVRGCLEVR